MAGDRDNSVCITGNMTEDPELRYAPSGTAVTRFGVAVNRSKKVEGGWEEEAHFFQVTAFGELAENLCGSLHKGTRVTATGRLEQRRWETDEGEKRSMVAIVADDVAPSLRWATAALTKIEKNQPKPTPHAGGGGVWDREDF